MKNKKNITDRSQLRSFFRKGKLPEESHFMKLIDSTFNKKDDRLDIDDIDGLKVYPANEGQLISFFEDTDDEFPKWTLVNTEDGIFFKKVRVTETTPETDTSVNDVSEEVISKTKIQPEFFISEKSGNIGLGTNTPTEKLQVNGLIASKGRVGTFIESSVPADGSWYNVFANTCLDGCNAYEIMASARGERGEGLYSILHAIAISTFGNSKPKINKTIAHYGKKWNKIDIKWESRPSQVTDVPITPSFFGIFKNFWERKEDHKYNLKIRTKSNYGEGARIKFRVSVLWDSSYEDSIV